MKAEADQNTSLTSGHEHKHEQSVHVLTGDTNDPNYKYGKYKH